MILENLETERTYFRSLTHKDKDQLMEFFNSEEALRFFPITPGEEACKTWIDRQLARYEANGYGLCAVVSKNNKKILGMCGLLKQEVDGKEELEVGYSFLPSSWGKGYATEAAVACRNFALKNKMAESIISIIHIDNIPSQKVAERNGMTREKQTMFREMPVFVYRFFPGK